MGKAEDEQALPSTVLDAEGTTPRAGNSNGCCLGCSMLQKVVTFRCVFVLVLGFAVLLSAIFWLPFFHFGDHKDLDLDYGDHDIVASFMLQKPASFLEDYILQLKDDIFDEISFSSTKVEIISLQSAGLDVARVVFAVESDVLKFRGGITASPEQNAFLMQSVQIHFNFTLNFSIDQLLNNFDELRGQLKTGINLAPYENLYIRLTNLKGSTIAPPTTVQSQVLLAVGINPSKSRLKQLAQTITGSHSKNLGLNNTVFGRVKQVQLSSVLQHSLGGDASGPSPSPSQSPLPPHHRHHHHHHHHHRRHHHHHDASRAPNNISPSPSTGSHRAGIRRRSPTSTPVAAPAPPPGCHFGYNNRFPWKHNIHSHAAPSTPPSYAPDVAQSRPKHTNPPPPKPSPAPAASPPNAAFAHLHHPPPEGEFHASTPNVMSIVSPLPSPSSAGTISSNMLALLLVILLVISLL